MNVVTIIQTAQRLRDKYGAGDWVPDQLDKLMADPFYEPGNKQRKKIVEEVRERDDANFALLTYIQNDWKGFIETIEQELHSLANEMEELVNEWSSESDEPALIIELFASNRRLRQQTQTYKEERDNLQEQLQTLKEQDAWKVVEKLKARVGGMVLDGGLKC